MERLTTQAPRQILHDLHTRSRRIINLLVRETYKAELVGIQAILTNQSHTSCWCAPLCGGC
jgi:hypothetical protein